MDELKPAVIFYTLTSANWFQTQQQPTVSIMDSVRPRNFLKDSNLHEIRDELQILVPQPQNLWKMGSANAKSEQN
jgi:hypothetical protein